MEFLYTLGTSVVENWPVWLVTVLLVVAAVIDGLHDKFFRRAPTDVNAFVVDRRRR